MKTFQIISIGTLFLLLSVSCSNRTDRSDKVEPLSMEEKPKILWFDATANFERFSYQDSITYYLEKTKDAGFTDVVVCARPVSGDALYKSEILDEITHWRGVDRDIDWDYLDYFITESKRLGLNIYASMNVFSGGHNYVNEGVVFRDEEFADMTTLLYEQNGFVDIKDIDNKYSVFFNPVNPDVQEYVLDILEELTVSYDLDGVILDRARFDGIGSDFSELSKLAFEEYIGEEVSNFPGDIYDWIRVEDKWERVNGRLFNKWIEWRAKVIYDFFADARDLVKSLDPETKFGTYTGAWYPTYYNEGVNWASQDYDASADFTWATEEYSNYGYAGLLDIYMTGVYYDRVQGDDWYSVQGGLKNAKRIVKDDVHVSGGLFVEIYKNDPETFSQAVEACLTQSDGLMIFDIVHLIDYGYWDAAIEGINRAMNR
ncbi:alpha amylase family protein [Marinilabiliaceae bacterium ANBcel2]|nr:alpha amylase family protein [Marinilabiliaceae bacterium ANBcel2]